MALLQGEGGCCCHHDCCLGKVVCVPCVKSAFQVVRSCRDKDGTARTGTWLLLGARDHHPVKIRDWRIALLFVQQVAAAEEADRMTEAGMVMGK